MNNIGKGSKRNVRDTPQEIKGLVSCHYRNINQSGLLCRTSKKIDEMTLLAIKFQIPSVAGSIANEDVWVECSGVVVYCEKKETTKLAKPSELAYEVAIYFNQISDRYRSLLARYDGSH